MQIVLDSSAAVEMELQSNYGLALSCSIMKCEKVMSCTLLQAEVASVYRKLERLGKVARDEVSRKYENALSIVEEFYPLDDLRTEALSESVRLNHSVYNMFYFILARRTGACLYTLDKKLATLCIHNGVNCIQEFELPELLELPDW